MTNLVYISRVYVMVRSYFFFQFSQTVEYFVTDHGYAERPSCLGQPLRPQHPALVVGIVLKDLVGVVFLGALIRATSAHDQEGVALFVAVVAAFFGQLD